MPLEGRSHDINLDQRPIVIFLPWLGATTNAIRKYEKLYTWYNVEFMVYHVRMKDFLWPKTGLQNSLQILQEIKKKVQHQHGGSTRPVIIHSFSIGCYFYSLMLWHMKENPNLYDIVKKSIVAQIIDSPVVGSLSEMANGVTKMFSSNSKIGAKICKSMCMFYFAITKKYTVTYYDKALSIVKFDAPRVPMLIFASENDPMLVPVALDEYVKVWKRTQHVQCKVWKESVHTNHFVYHPEEYTKLINELLASSLQLGQVQLKSKL